MTEFHFLRGSWQPSSRNVDDKPVRQDLTKPYAATDDACAAAPACVDGSDTKKDFVIHDEVLRTQAAMGCPLTPSMPDSTKIRRLPCFPPAVAARLEPHHRERNPTQLPLPLQAMVARPVNRAERDSKPEALAAVAKAWQRLRYTKHKNGVGVWDESKVKGEA